MNKPTKFITEMLGVSLVLGMMTIGCEQDSGGEGGGSGNDDFTVTNAQVYQENFSTPYTGSGTVKIGDISVGSVTDGKLTFELPSSVPSQYLDSFSEGVPSSITVSPSNAKSWGGEIDLFDDNTRIGYLSLMNNPTGSTAMHQVMYLYFDIACSIRGSSDGWTYSIDASVGWNKVYMNVAIDVDNIAQSSGTITTNLSNVPSDLKWAIEISEPEVIVPAAPAPQ
jgi:hypothetical protein